MTDSSNPANLWRLTCTNLCVRRGSTRVLDDVSLELHAGQTLAVVGPNGSGKTSLLLALLGLLPPERGVVRLNNRAMHRVSARERGRLAAYVPQTLESVPAFSVFDVVAGSRYVQGPRIGRLRSADHDALRAALDRCGVGDLAERVFATLSGGEQQKVLLAAAIAQAAPLLVLDEPNAGLDPAVQLELISILRAWPDQERSLVVVSHDLQMPAALGGDVVALQRGRIAAQGPVSKILTPETLERIYDAPFGVVTTESGRELILPAWWLGDQPPDASCRTRPSSPRSSR